MTTRRRRAPRTLPEQTDPERAMEFCMRTSLITNQFDWSIEYMFHPDREWRFDFAFIDVKIAVEVEGGTWIQGRHVQPVDFEKDCEKYGEAAIWGWRVLRVTTEMVDDGRAIALLERLLSTAKRGE